MDAMNAVLMPYATFPRPPVFEVPAVSDRVKRIKPLQQYHNYASMWQTVVMLNHRPGRHVLGHVATAVKRGPLRLRRRVTTEERFQAVGYARYLVPQTVRN